MYLEMQGLQGPGRWPEDPHFPGQRNRIPPLGMPGWPLPSALTSPPFPPEGDKGDGA